MSLCIYKRIREEPIRLNINGKMVIVRRGESIVAETRQMMGVSGFAFMGIYGQQDNFRPAANNLTVSRPNPLIGLEPDVMSVQIQEVNQQEFVQPPKVIPVTVIQETIKTEPVAPKVVGFNKESIDRLKSFDNKQWFALKKEEIIQFLEEANIEYKHISSDKWELLKFLKKIIKEL
jgi:hypothetical protein